MEGQPWTAHLPCLPSVHHMCTLFGGAGRWQLWPFSHAGALQVVIGDDCRLDPFSMAGPGLKLQRGEQLPSLATKPRRDAPGRKPSRAAQQKQTPSMAEASVPINSPALSASRHSLLQVRQRCSPSSVSKMGQTGCGAAPGDNSGDLKRSSCKCAAHA